MQFGQSASLVDGKVPVFVFPTSLTYYADDQPSHNQILHLYNPYDFVVDYKVLSNKPNKYEVSNPVGAIRAGCCIDLAIRLKAVNLDDVGITDKFRIQLLEHGQRHVIGKRDLSVTLLANKPEASSSSSHADADQFESLVPPKVPHAPTQYSMGVHRAAGVNGPSLVVVMAALICIAALMLPTDGLDESSLPSYLHLSVNLKLILSFTLGLVAMVILRT